MAELNCICIKYGTAYGSEYVNRLRAGLARNTRSELRFFCMTDDRSGIDRTVEILPLPDEPFATRMEAAMANAPKQGRLKKISLFRPDLITDLDGPLMVFDLDVAVVGPVDELRDFAPGKVCMRREWRHSGRAPSLGHGSVERFDPRLHGYLYEFMARDPEAAVGLGGGSEQTYTSASAARAGDFQPFPDDWIVSYKYDCRPARPLNLFRQPHLPANARVVCFHGRPKMDEAVAGYRAGLSSTRPCDWLRDAWMGETN
ncbi:glycosyl transferase [Tabrizicola soli]|uniref:Glycosyl transferase n=1 Tax=Tabrizicola soli TaxID=2185115 RepID=A0ABV7DZL9_9RHOB|nr:glycosyl transferase [Tabrizicola soli]